MSDAVRKVKNPLLNVAGQGFLESFAENAVLMPVTPASPAVLSDDVEPEGIAGLNSTNLLPTITSTTVGNTTQDTLLRTPPLEESKESTTQSQKQGYFTSILSSLPNLSLSAITRDGSKSQNYQDHQQPVTVAAATAAQHDVDPHVSLSASSAFLVNSPQDPKLPPQAVPFQSSPVPPPQLPPSTNPPPSGASVSYRLGNHRRLKYAPPPDLTSSASKQYQVPSAQDFFPSSSSLPSKVLNPNTPSYSDSQCPSTLQFNTGSTRGHGSSAQSPFRNSSAVTPINTSGNFQAFTSNQSIPISEAASPELGSLGPSTPKSIPVRQIEPLTPQNTPATNNFSSFAVYEKQNHLLFPTNITDLSSNSGSDSVKDIENKEYNSSSELNLKCVTAISGEKTFTPILAAKVTEKLENLIAEQKEECANKKDPDFSAEVSEITSRIVPEDKKTSKEGDGICEPIKKSAVETLTEIDLCAPIYEIPLSGVDERENLASFSSASSFFTEQTANQKSSSAQLPPADISEFAFYNPNSYRNPNQSFEIPNSGTVSYNLSGDDRLSNNNNTEINDASTVLNPINETPVHTFHNPNKFGNQLEDPFVNLSFSKPNIPNPTNFSSNLHLNSSCSSPSTNNTIPEPTGKATLSPVQISINTMSRVPQTSVPPSLENLASGTNEKRIQYRPVYHHWFYRREIESKILWIPFSMQDSLNLEEVHNSNEITPETKVATDGGRYDVNILRRERVPVYWTGPANEVRRCSWFYKAPSESRYMPYEENLAAKLEEEYKLAYSSNSWNRKINLNAGEYIIFHSSTVQAHYLENASTDTANTWGNNAGTNARPRMIKRGVDEFHIEEGEPEKVDHLLFIVHGIGSVCDLKFRSVEEVVDEFRSISLQLVQSHYRTACDQGLVNRIEVLPISWHAALHSEDTGIDEKLKAITLTSIPKLRHFTNDTLLDILFYTSPVYCQTIMKAVGTEMNRLYDLFKQRNSNFQGNVYLGGHSLGSLILFDLLCHQHLPFGKKTEESAKEDLEGAGSGQHIPVPVLKRQLSRKISYVMGNAGTGQPYIHYPQLTFHPKAFFALGSPIGMFVTVRGIHALGEDFVLPTCPAFFNIFHPFDPVAYRVESLVDPEAHKYRPKLIPHHKGRKRMHLELKETMARVGADLKQKLLDSVRSTWNSVYQLAMFHKPDNQTLEREIDKVVEEQLSHPPNDPEVQNEDSGEDLKVGKLNGGRRIDYVLQEAPFEYINEYIFALTSHVCYWESEDTMLLILKEIYGLMGIQTDAQLPQNISIDRVSALSAFGPSSNCHNTNVSPASVTGMDPTAPMSSKSVGPPPTSGFIRKA